VFNDAKVVPARFTLHKPTGRGFISGSRRRASGT
jgi:hypothetical protein